MNIGNVKKFYKPSVIMSIHGYLSTGKWQSKLSEAITSQGLRSKEFKYGFTIRFDKIKIDNLVDRFKSWYFEIVENPENGLNITKPFYRPSIVAHSLGTWIVAKALEKYPEIKFDKIFLHGSIVPRHFNWYSIILNGQVSKVVYERSNKDGIVRFGVFITGSIYPCCKFGFTQSSTFIKFEEARLFRHSDFQYKERFISQFEKHLYEEPLQLKIVDGKDLQMQDLRKLFRSTNRIDIEVYGNDYTNNNPITNDVAIEWAMVEKNIWSFMIDSYNNRVLGYINAMAVDQSIFDEFIQGKVQEADISSGNIKSFDSGGDLNIIIMSIALNSEIRNRFGGLLSSKPGELLIMALAQKLTRLSRKNQKIKRIASIAWSGAGENLCKSFGMEKSDAQYVGHPIYTITRENLLSKQKAEFHPLCKWWVEQI